MDDVTFGWVVIPGVAVSAVFSIASAVWGYHSQKNLKRIESAFRRSEEAFRLAQSPRVAAAIELWSAFCSFEEAVERVTYPSTVDLYEAPTLEDAHAIVEDPANIRTRVEQVRGALRALKPALQKAELLLEPRAFASCAALFSAYDDAYSSKVLEPELGPELRDRQQKRLNETKQRRSEALAALQAMIRAETTRSEEGEESTDPGAG